VALAGERAGVHPSGEIERIKFKDNLKTIQSNDSTSSEEKAIKKMICLPEFLLLSAALRSLPASPCSARPWSAVGVATGRPK